MVTVAQADTMLKNGCKLINQQRVYGNTASTGLDALYDTHLTAVLGSYQPEVKRGARQWRSAANSVLTPAAGRLVLDPILLTYAEAAGLAERDPIEILTRLKRYFVDNTKTLKSRNYSYGSVSAGTNTGDGLLKRLTYDEWGYIIETGTLEAKTAYCEAAQSVNSAEKGKERFRVRGLNDFRLHDELKRDQSSFGSGTDTTLTGMVSEDAVASNASFSSYGGTRAAAGADSTPTSITNWTLATGSISNIRATIDTVYRPAGRSDTTPTALKFNNVIKLTQSFRDINRTLLWDRPYYCQIAVRRTSSCDGTFSLRVGAVTINQTVSSLANDAWAIVGFDSLSTTNRKKFWPRNMSETDINIEIELASWSTGSLYVDDLILSPMTKIDGTWYALAGGATPFLVADSFSWTDALAGSDSVVQRTLAYVYGETLPHDSAAPSISDP